MPQGFFVELIKIMHIWKENIKEIAIKKISSELGMNERAVLKIIKKIFIQINNFLKNFVTFSWKSTYMLELLQFYKKYGGKVRCLKFNIKKPKIYRWFYHGFFSFFEVNYLVNLNIKFKVKYLLFLSKK